MLVTITYTGPAATDLGYLLHKHPGKVQAFDTSVGTAHVFYPEVEAARCTAAMLLEIDALALVRNKHLRGGSGADSLANYVNDRPYASSSMTAVALGQLFRTAMTGRCDSRPELAASAIPLEIALTAVPVKGGSGLAQRLFEPLGWYVAEEAVPLDPQYPGWGASDYVNLQLRGTVRLSAALRQVYVLLPVMDDSKHYWVGDDEVAKLLRAGEGWLNDHPERELITRRYLAHQRDMVDAATDAFPAGAGGAVPSAAATGTEVIPLYRLRADAVLAALKEVGAHSVADLGCGEGALIKRLLVDPAFEEIIGTDVSARALENAAQRLRLDEVSERHRDRVRLLHSSVTYLDDRLQGLDAAVLMEVVEHVDPERLPALEHSVFGYARPQTVVVTTPNVEYNALYPRLGAGQRRHPDHRFEWTRQEFQAWASSVGAVHGYDVDFRAVGEVDPAAGSPTQLALFRRG